MDRVQASLEHLFDQPSLVQLAIFVVHGLLVFALSMAAILLFNRRQDVARWTPVGPYFASISVVFALFLAFHGADIWANKARAERGFIDAGTAIKRLDEPERVLRRVVLGFHDFAHDVSKIPRLTLISEALFHRLPLCTRKCRGTPSG